MCRALWYSSEITAMPLVNTWLNQTVQISSDDRAVKGVQTFIEQLLFKFSYLSFEPSYSGPKIYIHEKTGIE